MSRFGDFEVVRTARLKCKRSNDPNADEDGMREYAYLRCPHCKTDKIDIPLNNIYKQKFTVIKDHIAVCSSYTGERPPKRGKAHATNEQPVFKTGWEEMKRKTTENEVLKAEMEQLKHQIMEKNQQLESLEEELEISNAKLNTLEEKISTLEEKTDLYDRVLAIVRSLR